MISFLNGEILKFLSDPKRIVLLVNGIGYEIYIPEYLNNYFVENKVTIGSNLDLEIYYHVTERQPKPLLVGFISYSDKEFFEQLIQVEGIGPVKAANSLVFPINIIINAIETEDNSLLEQMPGIGSRAAQKIIASLNGKLTYQNEVNLTDNAEFKPTDSIFEEALSGLISLGYKNNEARNAINEVLSENEKNLDVENIVREVLKKNTRKYV
ncbi:MAG: Holliday junction branch migration protein RuvA [Dehalococcoidia bacterium]|jgi:Holliday junction DNA helicase RuvA|nr:Holliday junction branch migration protein RuvA [Dehalococcoidia bacterium]|tara:strand:- start:167 stop:799 length:633 start_codon:yes stop_codon:yes gene_type:complete